MAENLLSVRYRLRHDTEQNFISKNPILLSGEAAVVYTPGGTRLKLGQNAAFQQTPYLEDATKTAVSAYGELLSGLTIRYIDQEEYYRMVKAEPPEVDPYTLYILSGEYINAYGCQVKNLSGPTDPDDAATKQYVDSVLTDYYTKPEVDQISANLAGKSVVHLNIPSQGVSRDLSSFVINKVTKSEYESLSNTLSDQLYIIDQKQLDASLCTIVNVARPVAQTDAATKDYVDNLDCVIYGGDSFTR